MQLTQFKPMLYFYNPWKSQKTFGFLKLSGGIEIAYELKMGWVEYLIITFVAAVFSVPT